MQSKVCGSDMMQSSSGAVLFRQIFYPLGFAVCIKSNRHEVLDMSEQSWGDFIQRSPSEPLSIILEVIDDEMEFVEKEPVSRIDSHLLMIKFDNNNFITADLETGIAKGKISSAALKASELIRYFILEAVALSMISTLRATALHAASVDWNGKGLLLCGESGVGKTSLAYACARAGWSYISDDASYLIFGSETREVTGNCNRIRFRDVAHRLFPELAGLPPTRRLVGKPSIEITTAELDGLRCVEKTGVSYIVFLKRDNNTLPGLQVIEKKHAHAYFTKFLLRPAQMNPHSKAAFDQLLGAEVFELRNIDLDWSVNRLRDLMERGQ